MAVLSQAVIDAGARVGQIVKYYETVAALLASTDTVAEDEFVQAGQFFYKGAASGATDHHVRMNSGSGSKLYCIGNPYVTPTQFGASPDYLETGDETSYVQAAFDSRLPVFLDKLYRVTSVKAPLRNGFTLVGSGQANSPFAATKYGSGLWGISQTSEGILITNPCTDATETQGHYFANFHIVGNAKRGLVVAQNINSHFDTITVAINASDGGISDYTAVVVEQSFGLWFTNIQTGFGCKVDLRINQCVLDTTFDLFYSNNTSAMHHVEVDGVRKDVAYANSAGNALVNFNLLTLQGARSYAIKMRGQSSMNFRDTYTEMVNAVLLVKDCDYVNFYGGELSCTEDNGIWLDQTEGNGTNTVNFFGTQIATKMVVGSIRQLGLYGCNFSVETNLLRTNSSYKLVSAMETNVSNNAMALTSIGEAENNKGSTICLKTSNGSGMSKISVNSSGTVSGATEFSLTSVAEYPISPVAWFPNYNPTFASGAAITPFTVQAVGGTSPYTFTIVGDVDTPGALPTGLSINSSTGQITGTPTTPGTYQYKVRVTDSGSGTSKFWDETYWQTITIT